MAAKLITSVSPGAFSTDPSLGVPADHARFLRSRAFLFVERIEAMFPTEWCQSPGSARGIMRKRRHRWIT